MSSQYRIQLNDWLKKQSFKADQVLDVGGGDTSIRKMTNLECNRYLVLDNDNQFNPSFTHDLNEFKHADELFVTERNPRFDLIFCMNVFEYIWQPYNAMANLYTWLSENGTLVVNFPFLYPLHNPVGIDYLRYTNEWVNKIFHERFKFKEVEIFILDATNGLHALDSFYSLEKMHRRKGDESWKMIGCIVKARK